MNKSELALIKRALLDVEIHETKRLESFPRVDLADYPEYDRQIDKIIAAEEKRNTSVYLPPRKLIAILVAAALLISITITVFAFREPIFNFFEEIFEKFTHFSAVEENPEPIEEGVYLPMYLPEGFEQTGLLEKESIIQTTWSKETERIMLKQNIHDDNNLTLDTEYYDYEIIHFDGCVFYYLMKNNMHFLLWSNEKYSYTLWCTSGITLDEAIKIATSLEIKPQETEEAPIALAPRTRIIYPVRNDMQLILWS